MGSLKMPSEPTPKACLITGANAGIGRAAALQLAEKGCTVWLGCRDTAKGEEAAQAIRAAVPDAALKVLPIDMSLQSSIRRAAEQMQAVDVIIHNAAYFDISEKQRSLTVEGIERTWATNYLGPALLTELLVPRLKESHDPRVIAITSKGLAMQPRLSVDLNDPEFERRSFSVPRAYYQSKLAHLAFMLDFAEQHNDIVVHGVRVTNVKVDIRRYPGLSWIERAAYRLKSAFSITPEEMARTYTWLATADEPKATTGGYWDAIDKKAPVSQWAANPENRERLRTWTKQRLNLS